MIEFRQKVFSEYDAMRSLYVELMKDDGWRRRVRTIGTSSLIPILRGNNIVIERFVITTRPFKKDRYRMYLKIGAKAKMPDAVRLPGTAESHKLWGSNLTIKPNGIFRQKNNSEIFEERTFDGDDRGGGGKDGGKKKNKGGGDDGRFVSMNIDSYRAEINYETMKLRGDTIEYNKKDRSIVIEYDTIRDAINSLNILPFGLNYDVYLLDV